VGDTVSSVKPYDAQRHKLEYGWNESRANYENASNAGPYQGQFYSGLNSMQTGGANNYFGFLSQLMGGGAGAGASDPLQNSRAGGAGPQAQPQAGPGQAPPQGGGLTGQLQGGASSNLANAGNYGQNAQQNFANYGGPATAGITARVNQYMQDPALNASINASKQDIFRDLQENTLPSVDRGAAMAGNTNSSRTGIAEGLAMRGADDKAANIDAQMRSGAYNQALGAAQNDYFGGANTALQANNQVGQSAQMGQNMAFGALGLGQGVFQGQQQAGGLFQNDQNNQNQANRSQYEYQNGGYQNGLLSNYLNQVGGSQWGSTTTAPAQNGTGAQGVGGLLGTVGGGILGSFLGNPTMGASLGNLAGQGLGSLL
jgi:hypothetical protein